MSRISFATALEQAMAEEMRRDERVYFMATAPSASLLQEFGPTRVRRTPISEATLTGMAVGSAGCGERVKLSHTTGPSASSCARATSAGVVAERGWTGVTVAGPAAEHAAAQTAAQTTGAK